MLELSQISYSFRDQTSGVDPFYVRDISLELHPGEIIALVGASASGKSTLAQLMGVQLVPDSGAIRIDGEELSFPLKPAQLFELRKNVAILRQDPDAQILLSTVYEDIAFGPCNLGLSEVEIHKRVNMLLDRLDLRELMRMSPDQLSGGQKQRVALAGILAMQPRYLILDEPCSMLDARSSADFLTLCSELVRESDESLGILLITHNLADLRMCSRVYAMREGVLVFSGSCEDFLSDPQQVMKVGCELTPLQSMLHALELGRKPSSLFQASPRMLAKKLLE